MNGLPAKTKEWELTRRSFDKVLASLHPNRDRAAERYEIIRLKLITFFENRGCQIAEELADETMNRVAKRLEEGIAIYTGNPDSYFYGVARNVLKEYWARPRPVEASSNDEPCHDPLKEEAIRKQEQRERVTLGCQKCCVEGLSRELRNIVIEYYREHPGVKMKKQREALAARLGMTPNALRIKACRIRDKLDECVRNCIQRIDE